MAMHPVHLLCTKTRLHLQGVVTDALGDIWSYCELARRIQMTPFWLCQSGTIAYVRDTSGAPAGVRRSHRRSSLTFCIVRLIFGIDFPTTYTQSV